MSVVFNGNPVIQNRGIVTSGLILWLDAANSFSYPGTGNVWYDLSGKGNHFIGGAALTWNKDTGFSAFTQTNRWYNSSTSWPSNLKTSQGGNGYTTLVWAKCTGVAGWQKFIGNGDEQGYIDVYAYASSAIYHQEDGSTLFYNNNISVNNDTLYMADSVWRMYGSTNLDGGAKTNPTDNFGIGGEGDAAYSYPFLGNIAVVMLYDRVLTSTEITQNFNAQRSRFGI